MLETLAKAVSEGWEPGLSRAGLLQILVVGNSGEAEPWFLEVSDANIGYGSGCRDDATAALVMDTSDILQLQKGQTNFRDLDTMKKLRPAGDLAFMQELVTACSRPEELTVRGYDLAARWSKELGLAQVARCRAPSPSEFAELIAARRPCVLQDFLQWQAFDWNFEHIRKVYGHEVCRPDPSSGERLSTLIDALMSGESVYSYGCAVPESMRAEFSFPMLDEQNLSPRQLWIGSASKDPVTGLHRDARPVLLAQVIGRKRLVLFPPHQASALYPRRAHNTFYQSCWVDPVQPDLEKFPNFKDATPIVVDLHPREVLYIPIGWFHYVYALDDVLSVSTIIRSGELLERVT
jgi:hypothetical protein